VAYVGLVDAFRKAGEIFGGEGFGADGAFWIGWWGCGIFGRWRGDFALFTAAATTGDRELVGPVWCLPFAALRRGRVAAGPAVYEEFVVFLLGVGTVHERLFASAAVRCCNRSLIFSGRIMRSWYRIVVVGLFCSYP
jgi:hypothetical protein